MLQEVEKNLRNGREVYISFYLFFRKKINLPNHELMSVARECGHLLAGTGASNPAGFMGVCLL
jgi:hypothetical protein